MLYVNVLSMKRDQRLHVKLNDEEKAALEARAVKYGTKMSVVARIALRRDLGLPVSSDLLSG